MQESSIDSLYSINDLSSLKMVVGHQRYCCVLFVTKRYVHTYTLEGEEEVKWKRSGKRSKLLLPTLPLTLIRSAAVHVVMRVY